MRLARSILTACLVVAIAACTPSPETTTQAPIAHTQADIDRFIAEGPEPTLRKLAPFDYYLHYKLMQATGMDVALGGEAAAISALRALGEAYERSLRGEDGNLPRLQPVKFTAEGMNSGLIGISFATVPMMSSGLGAAGNLGNWNEAQLQEAIAKGPMPLLGEGSPPGSPTVQYTQTDATITMDMEVKEGNLAGKMSMKFRMDTCPDASGKVTVDIEVASDMALAGNAGSGGKVTSRMHVERHVDDDARLIDSDNDYQSTGSMTLHGRGGSGGGSMLDLTLHTIGDPTINDRSGIGLFDGAESARVVQLARGTQDIMSGLVHNMLTGLNGAVGKAPWESGQCVRLDVTSSPTRRKGVKPGTRFQIEAKPRASADSLPTGGTVQATLSGGQQLEPSGGKIPADAKYTYAAPDKKDESASIALEARSRRGVGRATLEFDTKQKRAYHAAGGGGHFHGSGTICDLEEPFTLTGSGVTMTFTPSSAQGGSYAYQGNMSGFAVWGGTSYTVSADENGGSMTGTGSGCVRTPMGTRCANGTEKYTLTPTDPCE